MAKQMVFEADARESIRRGVEKLAKAVTTTLGPRGRNAILDKGWGDSKPTPVPRVVHPAGRPWNPRRRPAGALRAPA